jgi:hypothetical protein
MTGNERQARVIQFPQLVNTGEAAWLLDRPSGFIRCSPEPVFIR